MNKVRTVVLLSGGADSAVLLANLVYDMMHEPVLALSLHYQQQAGREVRCAARVAKHYDVEHVYRQLAGIPGSALTDHPNQIREGASKEERADVSAPPQTYVPMRNMILLAYGAAYAYTHKCEVVAYGAHSVDAPYPDCTPEFVRKAEAVIQESTATKMRVLAPLLWMTKTDVIALGLELGVPFDLTYSCYKGGAQHCGVCDACLNRIEAFKCNQAVDPVSYQVHVDW
jgi:7-cyano-7-deazaguanine synthase